MKFYLKSFGAALQLKPYLFQHKFEKIIKKGTFLYIYIASISKKIVHSFTYTLQSYHLTKVVVAHTQNSVCKYRLFKRIKQKTYLRSRRCSHNRRICTILLFHHKIAVHYSIPSATSDRYRHHYALRINQVIRNKINHLDPDPNCESKVFRDLYIRFRF